MAASSPQPSQPFTMLAALDRVTGFAMDPGVRVRLSGWVASPTDGRSFDAAVLFDFAAGGLRVVDGDPAQGAYILVATGDHAPACAAAGAPSPCLVPRLAELAHERMHTVAEFASTLSGSVELESPSAADIPVGAVGGGGEGLLVVALVAVAGGLASTALALARIGSRSVLGRIRLAARRALRATRHDDTLAAAGPKIAALVDRARHLDRLRRTCARRLGQMNRKALDHRVDTLEGALERTNVDVDGIVQALACLSAERAQAALLESDHASAVLGLERIESALRVVALRARARESACERNDPVDALVSELDLRDEAMAEAGP